MKNIKKLIALGLALTMAMATLVGCGAKEEAPAATVVAAPVATAPATPVAVGTVREERVQLVSGQGLKAYSVVCGSFGVKANADGLKAKLDRDGYNAMVVYTADKNMYRVIVSSFDSREDAARARDNFKAKYSNNAEFQKSWLLYAR